MNCRNSATSPTRRTSRWRNALAAFAAFALGGTMQAQNVNVSGAVTGNGTYPTLGAAITALAPVSGQTGANILIDVVNNTTEGAATISIGAGTWASMTIRPQGGAWTVSSATTAGNAMIALAGADNVTINGLNSEGNALTISNTTVSSTSGTCTITLNTDATSNTITNCSILGSSTMAVATNGGNIFFGAGAVTTGNDNNTVSNCNIGPAGANLPTKGIHFGGSSDTGTGNSGNVVNNNNIFDYFGAAVSSAGIYVASGTPILTITNNRFYQTATRTQTSGAQHSAVWITNTSGNGYQVTGNTIGYASNTQTGTYGFVGVSSSSVLTLIHLNVGTTTASDASNNTIAGIAMSGLVSGTSSSAALRGIYTASGLTTCNSNTIGSQSTTGSITFTSSSTSTADVIGIFNFGSSNWVTNNNNIGGITASNSSTGAANVYGLRCNTGSGVTWQCNNNIVGGNVANSLASTSTATGCIVSGILNSNPIGTFTGNTVRNLTAAGGTGTGTSSSVAGITVTSTTPAHTVSTNTIYNLSNTSTTAATVVNGINYNGSSGANVVERNLIYSLDNASATGTVNGILVAGGTTTYRNNMIRLGVTGNLATVGAAINGISEPAVGTDNFYHNSVYIGGSPTSGTSNSFAFNSTQTTNTRAYQNNILFNARSNSGSTGKHYAIRVGGTAASPAGLTSNYNVLRSTGTGGFVGLFNSIDRTGIDDWRTATGMDANSRNEDPRYLAPTAAVPDLHIDPALSSSVEGMGTNIASVTTDFDGETRSGLTPVDIGADAGNFTGLPLCAGTPPAGTIAGASFICAGSSGTTLTFSNGSSDLGLSYQWASSLTSGSGYNNMGTGTSQATGALTSTTYFIVTTTCSNGGATNVSPEFAVTVNPVPTASAGSNGPVCVNSALDLTATSDIGTSFNWTGPSSFSSTAQNPSVSSNATLAMGGTYSVTATAAGCTSAPATTLVVVNPAPSAVTITPAAPTICAGSSIQLTASGGTTTVTTVSGAGASTSVSNTTASTIGPNPMQNFYGGTKQQTMFLASELTALGIPANTPISSIAFNLVATNGTALQNFRIKAQLSTTVTALSTTLVSTGWNTVFGPQSITPVVGYNTFTLASPITWDGTSNLLLEINYTNNNGGSGSTNTATYDLGLPYNATYQLSVDNKTAAQIDGYPQSTGTSVEYVYQGRNQIRLGYSSPGSFTWAPSPELNTTTGAVVIATPAATNTYTAISTVNGCSTSAPVTVTIGAGTPPTASITAGGPTSFCPGGSVVLTSSTVNGCIPFTYSWSDGTNVVSTDPNYTASTSGSYTLTVTDNANQVASSNTIVVVAYSTPTINVTPPTGLICGTGSVELTASGAVSYAWSPGTGLSATTGAVVTASPTTTTTYTVTGTDANSCVGTGSATVTYAPIPAVTATSNLSTVCAGSSVNLTGSASAPSVISSGTGALTTTAQTTTASALGPNPMQNYYGGAKQQSLWLASELTALGLVSGTPINSIAINLATANPAVVLNDFRVKGQLTSSVSALTTTPVSTGWTTVFGPTAVTPATGWNTFSFTAPIVWDGTSNLLIEFNYTNNNSPSTGTNAATYDTGLAFAATNWYRVDSNTPASIDAYAMTMNSTYNGRNNVRFGAVVPTPATYSWISDPVGFTSTQQSPTGVVVNQSTTYTVTATSTAGCSNSAQVTVNVGTPAPPTVSITAGGPTTFCAGGSVLLSSNATGGCPALTYSWSDGTNVVGTSPTLSVTTSGSYTLTVTDANLTSASSNTIAVTVVANPVISVTPSAPVICGSGSVELTASGADTYTWAPATGLSATTGSTVSATLSASQTYTVTGTNTTTTCVGSTTVPVTVSPIPTVTVTPTSVDQCGGTAVLTASASITSLEAVLTAINTNSASILATVPTPSGFTDGVTGSNIGDGCSDMYDTGNTLNSNLGTALSYSDNTVVNSAAMGTGGRYFTRKIGSTACGSSPSMFFWAGDLNGVSTLNITGNLGADGSGTQQLASFTVSANGITYTALLKRVFGTTDPSVNQLFLIPQPNSATQTMGTTTDDNQHNILGLTGVTRFYYVLYAGAAGALITDTQAQAIAQSIVNVIPNGTISYLWSTTETTPAITVSTSGTYTVTATANGCQGTANVPVNIAVPSNAGTNGTLAVCNVDAPVALINSLGGTPDMGGNWIGPDALAHSGSLDPSMDAAGVYTYTVTGASPCPNVSATVTVTITGATVWYADTDGDSYGDPNAPLAACGQPVGYVANNVDNCPADGGKRDPGVCGCGTPDTDTDGDGIADCIDSCPAVPGQIGSTCNDGNPNTVGDVLNASCTCAGTVVPPCSGNSLALILNTDAAGSQTSWEIIPLGGGAPLCSGSNYASNTSITETCCVPNGCYQLRVLDSFGDGMTTGGYTLVDGSNNRIIDNLGNGAFTSVSQIGLGLGFCLPIGTDQMMASSCDQMNLLTTSVLQAQPNPFVSAQWQVGNQTDDGYQFWIYDPNGTYSRRAFFSHAYANTGGPFGATRSSYLSLANLITQPVPQFKVLNIRVRSMVNGVYSEFGPACRMKIDPAVDCQTTQLTTVGNPSVSCGAVNVPLPGGVLYANNVNGATRYQWEFTAPGYARNITSPTRSLTLTNWVTLPLSCGTTYNVRVRASYNNGASYCAFGPSCTITTRACSRPEGSTLRMDEDGTVSDVSEMSLWPNPNRGDLVNLRIDNFNVPVEQVVVDVMDLFGKRVMGRTINVDNGPLNTVLQLDSDLASGVYMVHVTAGEQTFVKRMVVQK